MPVAGESFNWPQAVKFSERMGAKSLRHFCELLVEKHSKNGVFASKVGWAQLYFLCRTKLIPEVFGIPRFIHVRRLDLLGQAISFVIAKQTGAWSSKIVSDKKPQYDAAAIAARLEMTATANARFEVLFSRFGYPQLEVVYEHFLQQDGQGVDAITEWLGLGRSRVNPRKTQLRPQRDTLNEEWRARFLSEQQAFFASMAAPGANGQ